MFKILIDYGIKKIQEEQQVVIPPSILNSKGLLEFNKALDSGNPLKVARFYKNFRNYYDLSILDNLTIKDYSSKLLKTDNQIIDKLCGQVKSRSYVILRVAGNLTYITNLFTHFESLDRRLKKNNLRMNRSIRISIFLFGFSNLVEIVNKYMCELLHGYIINNKISQKGKIKNFMKNYREKKLTLGNFTDTIWECRVISYKDESIFYSNKNFRNYLNHANLYYDELHKTIYTVDGQEYNIKDLKKDMKYLHMFMGQLIYKLNLNNPNINQIVDTLMKQIARQFELIHRDGRLKKNFQQVIFDWRKKTK